MRIAYFDCFCGIAGDMALGALLDCGIPIEALRAGLASLPVVGWHLEARPVLLSGIHATDVIVTLHGVTDSQEFEQIRRTDHAHDHEHHGHHHHHDAAGHSHDHQHSTAHEHGRSMREICDIIEQSSLSAQVKATSLRIFHNIAQAEGYLHHKSPDEVHFHEIGGIDSLLDICGVAWCLEYLEVDEVHCSPLPYSSGFIECAHGTMPVPAPATLELLKGVPMVPTDLTGELVTPTGAAIIKTLCTKFGLPPAFVPARIGAGAGKKRFASRPNMVRVIIGELWPRDTPAANAESELVGLEWENLSLVACNIDDMNPEFYDFVMERLLAAGALDVWLQPIQMKKNRPAITLHALCREPQQAAVMVTMLRETTTLGVRLESVRRAALPRTIAEVETRFGRARVKIAEWPQTKLRRAIPEYADVAQLAATHNVPVAEVYRAVIEAGSA